MTIIAGCILQNSDGHFLLVQERQEKVYGLWNIPAGWMDTGETPAQAAIRETKEEVGLDVTIANEPVFEVMAKEKDRHYYAFTGKITGGHLRFREDELLDARWLTYSEIETLARANKMRDNWIFEAISKVEHENSGD